jgi:hypothetical protein
MSTEVTQMLSKCHILHFFRDTRSVIFMKRIFLEEDGVHFILSDTNATVTNLQHDRPAVFLRSSVFNWETGATLPVTAVNRLSYERSVVLCTFIFISRLVEALSDKCFVWSQNLESVAFETECSLRQISASAFGFCLCLTSVVIPRAVRLVCKDAFRHCYSLFSVYIAADSELAAVEAGAFSGCSHIGSMTLPRTVTRIGPQAVSRVADIRFEAGNTVFAVEGNFILSYDHRQLITSFGLRESVTIPRTIEEIHRECFIGHSSLLSVSFESGSQLRRIRSQAFRSCQVKSIVIPRGVVTLGRCCFQRSQLESIRFEDGSELRRIGIMCFKGCRSMTSICIPKHVASVGDMAFKGSKVDCITIEKGNRFLRTTGAVLIDIPGLVLHNKSMSCGLTWVMLMFLIRHAWIKLAGRNASFRPGLGLAALFMAGNAFTVVSMLLHPSLPGRSAARRYRMAAVRFSKRLGSRMEQIAAVAILAVIWVSASRFMLVMVLIHQVVMMNLYVQFFEISENKGRAMCQWASIVCLIFFTGLVRVHW